MNLDTADRLADTAFIVACTTRIDVRRAAPEERHPLVLSALRELAVGQALELVNNHDPRTLHYLLYAQMPGCFDWQYVDMGPLVWRVSITKLSAEPQSGTCCGACGGA